MLESDQIVDAHHHLWDYPTGPYMLEQLRADIVAVPNVVQTIYVECGSFWCPASSPEIRSLGETARVRELAVESASSPGPTIAGIVARIELRLGTQVRGILLSHIEAADGRLVGIRDVVAWHPHPDIRPAHTKPPAGLLLDSQFRKGADELAREDLVFDAWAYQTQLDELLQFARALPELRIVVNHMGGPLAIGPYAGRRAEVLEAWRHGLAPLARCDNVTLKIGGLGMSLYGLQWHKRTEPVETAEVVASWRDPVRWCIDIFGPQRCMFESNFPIDRPSLRYPTIWDAFDTMTADLTTSERAFLFGRTARQTYGLAEP